MISNIDTDYTRSEAARAQEAQAAQTATKAEEMPKEAPPQKPADTSGIKMQYHTDRAEISDEGKTLATQQSAQADTTSILTQTETEEETSSANTNLTALTEQQLNDLASNGAISQQQLNTELTRRNAIKQEQEAQNPQNTARAAAFVEE